MSIAKAIIDRLGGKIGFNTEVGVGTTFYFDLPARLSKPESKQEAANAETSPTDIVRIGNLQNDDGKVRPQVLHVEDDDDACTVLCELIGDVAKVTSTKTALDALEQLESNPFDLVVLDIHLAGGDGYAVIRHLSGRDRPPRVLVYSVDDVSTEDWPVITRALVKSRADIVTLRAHIIELLDPPRLPTPMRYSA